MFKNRFYLGTFLFLIIIVLACGSKDSKAELIGKWVVVKHDVIEIGMKEPRKQTAVGGGIEFLSDKTYISDFMRTRQGTWTILDDGRIKINDMFGGLLQFAIIIDGKMIMENPNDNYYKVNKLFLEKKAAIAFGQVEESQYKTNIIGTWQNIGKNNSGKITIEQTFNKDMSHIIKINSPGRDTVMSNDYYKFIEKDRIETGGGLIYTIRKISNDELTLYREDIQKGFLYKRILK